VGREGDIRADRDRMGSESEEADLSWKKILKEGVLMQKLDTQGNDYRDAGRTIIKTKNTPTVKEFRRPK